MVVVCLGEGLIDLVPPTGVSPGDATSLAVQPGGAPLNVCAGLARLGCESLFLGCLSEDTFGRRLSRLIAEEGVERIPDGFVANQTRLAVVDQTNTSAPFRFYGNDPADSRLSTRDVDEAFSVARISGLYAGSLMMTNASGLAVQQYALDRARERGFPVYSDPNPRPAAWPSHEAMVDATTYLLSRSTLAKLSLDDARTLGWPDRPEELISWCEDRFSTNVFVTGGADGCWAQIDDAVEHVQAVEITPVDPTGAGDASFAALIAQVQKDNALAVEHLRYAAAAGALTTLTRGAIAAFPTQQALERFLAGWT